MRKPNKVRVVYSEPPENAQTRTRGHLARKLADIRDGQWARVIGPVEGTNPEGNARTTASQIRNGKPYGIAPQEYETMAGQDEDGEWYIWVRKNPDYQPESD